MSEKYQLSQHYYQWMKEHGLKTREEGPEEEERELTRNELIIKLYSVDRMKVSDIAAQFNRTRQAIWHILKLNGVKKRKERGFIKSIQGMATARHLVSEYFPLQKGNIVHHKDGDERNNALANLAVFKNQSDHRAFHHGANIPYIWEGASEQETWQEKRVSKFNPEVFNRLKGHLASWAIPVLFPEASTLQYLQGQNDREEKNAA